MWARIKKENLTKKPADLNFGDNKDGIILPFDCLISVQTASIPHHVREKATF